MKSTELRRRREEMGLSVQELAEAVGVTPDLIRGWESGVVFIGEIARERLEAVLIEQSEIALTR